MGNSCCNYPNGDEDAKPPLISDDERIRLKKESAEKEQLKRKDAYIKQLQNEKSEAEKHLKRKDEELMQLRKEAKKKLKSKEKHAKERTKMVELNKQLQTERDDALLRLSAVYAATLLDSNPNIADLSDVNRPTKLAERFSELYDNEWTDTFEVLSTTMKMADSEACLHLLQLLGNIYGICKEKSIGDLEKAENALATLYAVNSLSTEHKKRLKEERKKTYKAHLQLIKEQTEQRLGRLPGKFEMECESVRKFQDVAIELCWLMAIQDPPVYFDSMIQSQGEKKFDSQLYRPYTKSGNLIKYIVWPVLYLHEGGSILCKGIAQGNNKECEIESTAHTVDNTD